MYRFKLWLSGDKSDAEGITSETFARAWARNEAIRTETPKAYLFAIARNLYLQQLSKRSRQVAVDDAHPDPAPGRDKVAEARLDFRRVQRLLQNALEPDRAASLLRVQHRLACEEIARAIGISGVAARVKVHRERRKLIAEVYVRGDGCVWM